MKLFKFSCNRFCFALLVLENELEIAIGDLFKPLLYESYFFIIFVFNMFLLLVGMISSCIAYFCSESKDIPRISSSISSFDFPPKGFFSPSNFLTISHCCSGVRIVFIPCACFIFLTAIIISFITVQRGLHGFSEKWNKKKTPGIGGLKLLRVNVKLNNEAQKSAVINNHHAFFQVSVETDLFLTSDKLIINGNVDFFSR